MEVNSGAELQQQARLARPDVVLIFLPLPDVDAMEACRAIRQDPLVPAPLPLIGIAPGPVTRERRLGWLRAGAWDCFGFPLDAEELRLKLDGYVRAKRQVEALALLDQATGLYTHRGVKRRARELIAEAVRLHTTLACVVFGLDQEPEARGARPGAESAARSRLGRLLKAHARLSDTVGWWNDTEVAVLAPATNADGAAKLAERLADAIETAAPLSEPGAAGPPSYVLAGYDVVSDLEAGRMQPEDLLARAMAALQVARIPEPGLRIRRFEPSA